MQIKCKQLLLCTLLLLTSTKVHALDRSWFGTWKLNRASSHLVGPSITIVRIPYGYHFDFGAVSFDIGDDGKEYPTVPRRTTSLKSLSQRKWLRVHKVDGREVDHGTIQLTPDNRTMLIHTVATDSNGHIRISDERLVRIGKGTGLAGTWRSAVAGINVSEIIVLEDAGGGQIRWECPQDGQFYVITPNGAPVPYQGPRSVPDVTVALQSVSPNEMRWTEFIKGTPYTQGIDKLGDDGKSMTETTWPVKRPSDRQEAVYDRLLH